MDIHLPFWETRGEVDANIFRDTSQCMGSLGVHGYCLSWPANCPEQHDTQPPQHTSQISDREFPWHAHNKCCNLLYRWPFWLCQRELRLAVSKEEAAFTHHNQVLFPLLVSIPPLTSYIRTLLESQVFILPFIFLVYVLLLLLSVGTTFTFTLSASIPCWYF